MRRFSFVLGFAVSTLASLGAQPALGANVADTLINMPADSWMVVPNSRLDQSPVAVPNAFPTEYENILRANTGFKSVTLAWSGGVYDPDRHKMIIWGGGHQDYFGNELYAFNVQTLTWERLTNPTTTGVIVSREVLDDGRPVSRHTYDGLAYSTQKHLMFAYGGSRSADGFGTGTTWTFDPASSSWQNRNPSGGGWHDNQCCGFDSEYDPFSKKVFMRNHRALRTYDFDTNAWTIVREHEQGGGWGSRKGVVDTRRRLYFSLGRGTYEVYDIAAGQDVTSAWAMSGGQSVIGANGPGIAYDSMADTLVAWVGGGPWVLNMTTKVWTRKSGVGAPALPGGVDQTTFGRFRYIPEYNVFILVNATDQNVYFYKHTGGFAKGDFDSDLQADLILRHTGTGQNVAWLMNGVARHTSVPVTPDPRSLDWSVAGVDDFNADRRNDLAFWNGVTGAVEFWMMSGPTGTAREGAPVPLTGGALQPPWKLSASADFDHDGRPDLLWRNFTTQRIEIWTLNGTQQAGTLVPSPAQAVDGNWEIVGTRDWNADGNTDFLWYNATSGKIVLWFMDADVVRIAGQFTNPPNAGANNWKVLAMGDYGSGAGGLVSTIDLVWRNATAGTFVVWYMDQAGNRTSGTFTTPDSPSPDPGAWTIVGPR